VLQLSSEYQERGDDSQRASFGGQRRPQNIITPDLRPSSKKKEEEKGSVHSRQKTADFNSHG